MSPFQGYNYFVHLNPWARPNGIKRNYLVSIEVHPGGLAPTVMRCQPFTPISLIKQQVRIPLEVIGPSALETLSGVFPAANMNLVQSSDENTACS